MRIAIGGIQHETNTFARSRAGLDEFEAADAWPGRTSGPALFNAVAGINLPIAGFIDEARAQGADLVPLSWCSAQPSGVVTRDAYETLVERLRSELRAAGRVDALYLDLHGAMVAEHIDDADGELLARVRADFGHAVPIVASLDFHANLSPRMVALSTALVSYRTYPHVDMDETGRRAARVMQRLIGRPKPAVALRPFDFLIPLTSQCTLQEPMRRLMAQSLEADRDGVLSVCFTPGFPSADVAECGPAVYACSDEPVAAADAADRLYDSIAAAEREFVLELASLDDAVDAALAHRDTRPLILADTQDNPGAGGEANTTTLLKRLHAAGVPDVLAGVICDPSAAERAHGAGQGTHVVLELGTGCRVDGESPWTAEFEVLALGDGRFVGTGPFYHGAHFELGPMALLRCGTMTIAVASRKQQAADQAMFRHLGIEPQRQRVLVLKSSVHFRADFGPIASRVLIVEAPGPNIADPGRLPFTKLRPGVRCRPVAP